MIEITIYQDSCGDYTEFHTKGHADYAEEGSDIVCAAVSALAINLVNSVERLTGGGHDLEQRQETGEMTFRLLDRNRDARLLMRSFVLGIQDVQEAYGPDYIRIYYKEV